MRAINLGDDVSSMTSATSVKSGWRPSLALTPALCTQMAAAETTERSRGRQCSFCSQHVAANCDVALVRNPGDGGRMYAELALVRCSFGSEQGLGLHALPVRAVRRKCRHDPARWSQSRPASGQFSLGRYWDEHYQRQVWFAEKASWQARWDGPRAPPSGASPPAGVKQYRGPARLRADACSRLGGECSAGASWAKDDEGFQRPLSSTRNLRFGSEAPDKKGY